MLAGTRDISRDKWRSDKDVVRIVDAVMVHSDHRLVRWAKLATLNDNRSQVDAEFSVDTDKAIITAARRISEAGARICAKPSGTRSNLVGAVLEVLAYRLASRSGLAAPDSERNVRLGHKKQSNPIEVVVDDDPFEAYECKYRSSEIEQADLDQLAAIREATTKKGRQAIVGVLTLDNWRTLQAAVTTLTIPGDIRHGCSMDLLELGDAPATRRLARDMSGSHSGM